MQESHTPAFEKRKRARIEHTDPPPNLPQFPHPFLVGKYQYGAPKPRTLVELHMMMLSRSIRNKPNWWEDKNCEEISSKWKEEALQQAFTADEFAYVLAELEYYDSLREGQIQPAAVDGVFQADDLIPPEVIYALTTGVSELEDGTEKDWHPAGMEQQVLDLVHPSLFCYIFGTTRQTEEEARPFHKYIGGGTVTSEAPQPPEAPVGWVNYEVPKEYSLSKKYQWLPSEFSVGEEGQVCIRSYINNLHPVWHQQLYPPIAAIFERFVPLFNKVLTALLNPRPDRITVDPLSWYNGNDDYNTRVPQQPAIPAFNFPPKLDSAKVVDLRGRKLQVIVKLTNIILTPEQPKYNGEVWHVEGMENEHIVASGIYYYDVSDDNITDSVLNFRQAICEPDHEEADYRGLRDIFGLENEGPLELIQLHQNIGAVVTKGGRCIAFPNTLQHQEAPFELKDPTKPGHRKILVFFLLDPSIRVISTANVPPQQRHWLRGTLHRCPPFNTLPPEIVSNIIDWMDWPMTVEQAEAHREELMKERKLFVRNNNNALFERPYLVVH